MLQYKPYKTFFLINNVRVVTLFFLWLITTISRIFCKNIIKAIIKVIFIIIY